MSIIIKNIRVNIDAPQEQAFNEAVHKLRISSDKVKKVYIAKKSLDAREKKFSFVETIAVDLIDSESESEIVKAISDTFVTYSQKSSINFDVGKKKNKHPIVIIGFGPAGIFCAYQLSKMGYAPIVFERGQDMDNRVNAVSDFWSNGVFNAKTNVQFGEGGAGTFSDGKLTTRISDSFCDYVLDTFIENGAPNEIAQQAKPHIGTDLLRGIIKNMRLEIIKNGGKIFFEKKLEKIITANGNVSAVVIDGETIETNTVVLAIGHSARDTFKAILDSGIAIENKPFSVGLRIEQLQETIDKGLYKHMVGNKNLPKGEYQLSHRCKDRCVYTFCMCPGGVVVPSTSQEGCVVTNGMSEHARNGKNANAGLVVSVDEKDYGTSLLAGMHYQEKLENAAFSLGGGNYKAPAQTVSDFILDKQGLDTSCVEPSFALGCTDSNLRSLFSNDINNMLRMGLQVFNQKLSGFADGHGILTGVESRTSSPVRILRDSETMQSVCASGLYPCGEGAGYAGGIMSAAVDGLHVAKKIISEYSPTNI